MKKLYCVLIFFSIFFVFFVTQTGLACTAILATKSTTTDGSIMIAHSDDNDLSDQRIMYVPAANHPSGSKRPVYAYNLEYPRYVGHDRGPRYQSNHFPASEPLGYIPEVPHTYAYIDGSYAVMNEHQLSFAESTTESKVTLEPDKDKRLLDVAALSRIAAERCKTAKEAVLLMGELAEKYGYYGKGETLLIGDKNEGWLFEISGTPTGESALWVAKKIPEGTVGVVANEFRIREIDPKDKDTRYSSNLFAMTEKHGWRTPKKGMLDWLRTVSDGEYHHPYYSLRRVWRIYSKLNPALKLSPWVQDGFTKVYPFSIKPAKKISLADLMALYRDHYEGTEFDLTKGSAAGPFGSPERYFGPDDMYFRFLKEVKKLSGAWERPISVHYAGFTTVCQTRDNLPDPIGGVVWIGLDRPSTTVFVPFYIGISHMPASYSTGSPKKFDRNTAWWAYNFVANWINLKYAYMIKDVKALQEKLEHQEFQQQQPVEHTALKLFHASPLLAKKFLTQYSFENAARMLGKWWQLADHLIAKYNQGFVDGKEVGYPADWLKAVGYRKGPTTYAKYK